MLAFFDTSLINRLAPSTNRIVISVIKTIQMSDLPVEEILVVTGFRLNHVSYLNIKICRCNFA